MNPVESISPVLLYDTDLARVALFGRQPLVHTADGFRNAIHLATALGALPGSTCVMRPASNADNPGYKKVQPATATACRACRLRSDGAILKGSGNALVMPSRDCASLWVENLDTKVGALGHCGREAIRPSYSKNGSPPLPLTILDSIAPRSEKRLSAYIFGSICPDCFAHESTAGQKCIADFNLMYGDDAFHLQDPSAGKLRMRWLIQMQIISNVPTAIVNRTCSRCDSRLSSFRNNDETCNLTVAVMK